MTTTKRENLIEAIKSIVLVVLLITTILLLYSFLGRDVIQNLIADDLFDHEVVSAEEILQPDRIEVSFGGGAYTVTENIFGAIMESLREFSEIRNLSIEEMTKERYEEIMSTLSIKAVFDYYVPFNAVCDANGIGRIPGSDGIDALSQLGYAVGFDDRLFVYDGRSDKYFRIIGSSSNAFSVLAEAIESSRGSFAFFPLSMIAGGVENNTLCPISIESDLYDNEYYPESFFADPVWANDLIRSFFSDNFDFVRRIEHESGTLIFMYGYGRTVVTAHYNGILEFKLEEDDRGAVQIRYLDALERANAFIAAHGGLKSYNGEVFSPYIKEVIIDPDGRRGFRFIFGIKIDDARVYYEKGTPIIVDVIGGRVTYYQRHLINPERGERRGPEKREVFPAINLLAENLEKLGDNLSFEELVEKVSAFNIGYVKTESSGGTLSASWIVTIDGLEYYFGLDTGEMI